MKVRLEEIAEIKAGGTPSRKKSEYWNGDIKWLKISDIKEKYISKTEETITELGVEKSSTKIFDKGTIVYTIFATLGEVAILNEKMATNQAIAGIKILDSKTVDSDYLYFYLISIKSDILNMGRGVAQNNINLSILRDIQIPLPPLKTQKTIANTLDQAKALIELRQQSIEKLDALAKSVFIDMFGDPVENPMGWENTNLGEVVYSVKDGPHESPKYSDEGIPFLSTRHVRPGTNTMKAIFKSKKRRWGIFCRD